MNPPRQMILLVLALSWMVTSTDCCAQVDEYRLDNGVYVVINPLPKATHVAVETAYEVGFLDEPESMVQASHLLEHLVCFFSE